MLPMYVFDTAVVNNDAAMNCCTAALIWLIARAWLRDTLTPGLAFSIGIASGFTLLTKPTALPIVAVAGLVVLVKVLPLLRTPRLRSRGIMENIAVYVAGVGALYGPWLAFRIYYYGYGGLVLGAIPVRLLSSVFGAVSRVAASAPGTDGTLLQIPAPKTYSLWSYFLFERGKGSDHFHWLLIRTVWGDFGWLDLPLAAWVYVPITVFCFLGLIGVAIQLVLQAKRRPILLLMIGIVLAQVIFLFAGADYRVFRTTGSDAAFGLQGRYFFPALVPFIFLLLSGWDHLFREHPVFLRLAPVAMLGVQIIALTTILSRYYGVSIG